MAVAAPVKNSPYQTSAQIDAQSANAKALASRKNMTPRRCGMGRVYGFASAIGPRSLAQRRGARRHHAAAKLVVERLAARVEERQRETEEAQRERGHGQKSARERFGGREGIAVQRFEALVEQHHARRASPEGDEEPRPGDGEARGKGGPWAEIDEKDVEPARASPHPQQRHHLPREHPSSPHPPAHPAHRP